MVGAWSEGQLAKTGQGEPGRLAAAAVTANLFETLGVQPLLGRVFAAGEDLPHGPRLTMLGMRPVATPLGGDSGIVGREGRQGRRGASVA